MSKKHLFTSESVTAGHPDKICDQISDAVLDAMLEQDPQSRVACETSVTTGLALLMGEITTNCYVDIPSLARQVIIDIGYDNAAYGYDGNTCSVLTAIDSQSSDIAMGVDRALEARSGELKDDFIVGAGDQGMMFGYACRETPQLMPAPITYAHELSLALSKARTSGKIPYLRSDGKTQVTIEYENDQPKRIDTIVVSSQHDEEATHAQIEADIIKHVIEPTMPKELLQDTRYIVNPTGRFVIGGPHGDSGLTGRKIIVDTYGGYARHGGGAFSGKDPTKVDRSAAYAARYAAKNIVHAGLAERCEIELAYAIGVARPVSVLVETFGTGKIAEEVLSDLLQKHFDLRPEAIIHRLDLRRPIYRQTAAYGHFGRTDIDLPWEKTDLAELLLRDA